MPRKTFLEKYCLLYKMTAEQARSLAATLDIQSVEGPELRNRKLFIDAIYGHNTKQLASKYHVSMTTVNEATRRVGSMLYHTWREDSMRSDYSMVKSVEGFASMANVPVGLVQELVDAPTNFRKHPDIELHEQFCKRLQGNVEGEDTIISTKLYRYFSTMIGVLHEAERMVTLWDCPQGDRWSQEAKDRGVTEDELREAASTMPAWTKSECAVFLAYCDGRTAREAVEACGLSYSYLISELKAARVNLSLYLEMLYPNKQINKVTWRFDRSYLLNCMQDTTHPLGGN